MIDDEPQILALLGRVLARAGYEVLAAADGQAAIDIFAAAASRIALVVLDRTLARRSGADVFAEIQRLRPGTRVIISSGNLPDGPTEFPSASGARQTVPAGGAGHRGARGARRAVEPVTRPACVTDPRRPDR